ncbi:MAG: HIT domain-containing protein [Candidatus Dormibacteria bacterium]
MGADQEDARPAGTPEALWAPWRMEYLKGPRPGGCPLCRALADDQLIVHRGSRAFVIMNLYPYSNGHVMVAPTEHVSTLEALDEETGAEMLALTRRAVTALRQTEKPEGFNVGYNLGKAAGAGIEDHIHQHIVPRWIGDTNFMPVIGGAKVIGEAIATTCAKLRQAF